MAHLSVQARCNGADLARSAVDGEHVWNGDVWTLVQDPVVHKAVGHRAVVGVDRGHAHHWCACSENGKIHTAVWMRCEMTRSIFISGVKYENILLYESLAKMSFLAFCQCNKMINYEQTRNRFRRARFLTSSKEKNNGSMIQPITLDKNSQLSLFRFRWPFDAASHTSLFPLL